MLLKQVIKLNTDEVACECERDTDGDSVNSDCAKELLDIVERSPSKSETPTEDEPPS